MKYGGVDKLLRYGSLIAIVVFGVLLGITALSRSEIIPPDPEELNAAIGPACETDPDIILHPWNTIVLHHTGSGRLGQTVARYHFLIDGNGEIRPTPYWKQQLQCEHTGDAATNKSGISIGLVGDFTAVAEGPSSKQLAAVVGLVKHLMKLCSIKERLVWRASEIDDTDSPGTNFPWRTFLYRLR